MYVTSVTMWEKYLQNILVALSGWIDPRHIGLKIYLFVNLLQYTSIWIKIKRSLVECYGGDLEAFLCIREIKKL